MDLLVKKVKEIEMLDDMRKRIVERCNIEKTNQREMKANGNFGIAGYRIEDMSGKAVVSDGSSKNIPMSPEQMIIKLPLENLEKGTYRLIIEEFVSEKKADQPLIISGNWECEF